jgi:hypothetical protein
MLLIVLSARDPSGALISTVRRIQYGQEHQKDAKH